MKIITVHGIRRTNLWHEPLPKFEESKIFNLEFIPFDYGFFSFRKFISSKHREKVLKDFCEFYNQKIGDTDDPPSVIAHSFGTYIVYQAMKKYDVIKFDKIIFCGSILNSALDFTTLAANEQFNILKNDHGELEWFLRFTRIFIDKDCGKAGKVGFKNISESINSKVTNSVGYKAHSDYFLPLHMKERWIPFLINGMSNYKYNPDILKPYIFERIYQNLNTSRESIKINSIRFSARISSDGDYYAKYVKEGLNEKNKTVEDIIFSTTGDGFHDADVMEFRALDKENNKLRHTIVRDINHEKSFLTSFKYPIRFREQFTIKYYFGWYSTINFKGDTDHWSFKNIYNIDIILNFPHELKSPQIFIVNNSAVTERVIPSIKVELDNTFTYTSHYTNKNNYDGAIFYFEGIVKPTKPNDAKTMNKQEVIQKMTRNNSKNVDELFEIAKASSSDIRSIYNIEQDIEHGNAASESTLSRRRTTFPDGFLVAKERGSGKIVGYIESIIWNEKDFETFDEISNFPMHYNVTGTTLYVIFLAVVKNKRKRGIGRRMLQEIERVAKRYNINRISLVAKNQLLDFYSKADYHEVRELPNFLPARRYKSILMEKNLKLAAYKNQEIEHSQEV